MNSSGLGWRSKGGQTTKLVGVDIAKAYWTRVGQQTFQLRLKAQNGSIYKFEGFKEKDLDTIGGCLETYGVKPEIQTISTKGWNWGTVELAASTLKFEVENALAFEIPLSEATSASVTKQEIAIAFNPEDDTVGDDCDSLTEIRFWVPTNHVATTNDDNEEIAAYNEDLLETPAQVLANKILEQIQVIPDNAQPLVHFENLVMSTPRGRCDLQMHSTFFFLAGKNYRVDYSHVVRLFLLPHASGKHASFVLSLEPPIRQGSTTYPLLVFQIPTKQDTVAVNQNGNDRNARAQLLGHSLQGPLHEIVSKVFGVLVDKKVTVPGSTGFRSSHDYHFVQCKYKTGDASLYPLENSFICIVSKTPLHIPFPDITSISFESASRELTLTIYLQKQAYHSFTVIPITEHLSLWNFCKLKNLKVRGDDPNEVKPSRQTIHLPQDSDKDNQDDDDDESDEEFQEGDESDESLKPDESSLSDESSQSDKNQKKRNLQPSSEKNSKQKSINLSD